MPEARQTEAREHRPASSFTAKINDELVEHNVLQHAAMGNMTCSSCCANVQQPHDALVRDLRVGLSQIAALVDDQFEALFWRTHNRHVGSGQHLRDFRRPVMWLKPSAVMLKAVHPQCWCLFSMWSTPPAGKQPLHQAR